jgi:uncharacterized membrane protein
MTERDGSTFAERVSDKIAKFGSSWTFIFLAMGCIFLWVVINMLPLFDVIRWDAYPFILLNLFLSLIAAFQAPFIMMSQRRMEIKQDMAYRGLFAELKNELVSVKSVLVDLTSVLRDLKEVVQHQANKIEDQADTIEEQADTIEDQADTIEELEEIAV